MTTSKTQNQLDAYCESVYLRTQEFWNRLRGELPTWGCRFSILYGPPVPNPDLMIIGANPGFNPEDLYDDEIRTWPTANEYWMQQWPLAVQLRKMFAAAGAESQLQNAVGTNLLFFKSRSLGKHESGLGWEDNPGPVRRQVEDFCREEVLGLMDALQPKAILALGLSTFDRIVDSTEHVLYSMSDRQSRRRVFAVGTGFGRRVIGLIHPTGARISHADFEAITRGLEAELARPSERANGEAAASRLPKGSGSTSHRKTPDRTPNQRDTTAKTEAPGRQKSLRPETILEATAIRPPGNFGYQPIADFWNQLKRVGPMSVEDFHQHMLDTGWRRPSGKPLTYDVMRTDLASMCKHGFARRV